MSSVILAIAGKHTLQLLGCQYLFVCKSHCRLDRYLRFGQSSQCGNCCKSGHSTTMSQDQKPTCGVYRKEHHTRFHPCPVPDCKGGGRCMSRRYTETSITAYRERRYMGCLGGDFEVVEGPMAQGYPAQWWEEQIAWCGAWDATLCTVW